MVLWSRQGTWRKSALRPHIQTKGVYGKGKISIRLGLGNKPRHSTTVPEGHSVTETEDKAFAKVEVMIDSELPWATNRTVFMKLKKKWTSWERPRSMTRKIRGNQTWSGQKNESTFQKNPEFYSGIKKNPEQR